MSDSYNQPPTLYDSAEWSQAAATDYDVSAQSLFINCPNPRKVVVRSDQAITIKFNATGNSGITVSANTAFELDYQCQAMYITTTTDTAVKILFLQ